MKYLSILLLLTASCLSCPPDDLLPDSKPWIKVDKERIFEGKKLYEYINGGAEIYYEYGFARVISQEYRYEDISLVVDIYQMTSPEAAYGIYSLQLDPKQEELQLGDDGTLYDYHIAFWQHQYYVQVMGYKSDDRIKKALGKIGAIISERIGIRSKPPYIISRLPKKYLVQRSQTYIAGQLALNSRLYLADENLLGIDGNQVKAASASYLQNNEKALVLAVRYKDNHVPEEKVQELITFFKKKYIGSVSEGFRDNRNQHYRLKISDSILYLVKGSSAAICLDILDQIPTETSE